MSQSAAQPRTGLSTWCGWVAVGGLALVPLLGWLGPMGFAVLLGLMGLLSLAAVRVTDEDRPAGVLLLVILVWAAMSTAWSPYHPTKPGNNSALKLALELPLYWAAFCGARRADPRLRMLALKVLAIGSAVFGVILLAEFATDSRIYETIHFAFYEPIRHDLSQVNIGHSTFVLALLWPLAFVAAIKARLSPWLVVPMILGTVAAAIRFGSDAPVISVLLAAGVGLATWRWSATAPKVLGVIAAVYWLGAPLAIWGVRATGQYAAIQNRIPLSWSERMGYWSHAVDWIKDHPIRGWGLDASRTFGPGIVLHPHDNALQAWLELGLPGVLLVTAVWMVVLRNLSRPLSNLGASAVAASASVYLLFGALNFGLWQEWWLGLAGLVAVCAALLLEPRPLRPST